MTDTTPLHCLCAFEEPLKKRRDELAARQALPPLVRRTEATKMTFQKFRNEAFDWRTGKHCVRVAHFHLRQMGHTIPTLPRIRSALSARRALVAGGWASVSDMLDSLLEPIAPARMVVGDIGVVPGDDGHESIVICLGPQKVLGWLPSGEKMVIYDGGVQHLTGAWRV